MPTETSNILQKITLKAGWQNGLITRQSYKQLTNQKFSFQYYIANNAFNDTSLNLDAIYFTDTCPVIYIKQLNDYNPTVIIELQKRFWNECRTPLTLIITPQIIKILDNYAKPVNNPNETSKIEKIEFKTTDEELERLADLLKQSKLDSEKVLGNTLHLNTNQRVDKKLISQLREARKKLHDKFKLEFSTIHDLLGRSLFTLYLEQRGILTKEDIKLETQVSDNFFDLLNNYPQETYILFDFLKEKFNGDLFPITPKEVNVVSKNPKILNLIYECYTHETDLKTGQKYLFNLFDFKHIPIELISAIYEEFMSDEDEKKNVIIDYGEKGKKELGAYYTPQMLVEFIYNEVLPMPSKTDYNYNIKILDPACGSGIFLAEGFKRIIERWKFAHRQNELSEKTLKGLLFNNIYGIEIHPEAIKITAFSLYLTFLHHMNPKEILRKVKFDPLVFWTKQEEVKQRDGQKSGLNLLQASTFIREGKAFKENPVEKVNAFFNTQFNIVIGNPPWKSGNVDEEIKTWANQEGWDIERDIIKGFLAYSPAIAPNATIALIASAKVLFNTSGTDDKFRYRFFSENKVTVIANFSIVRQVLFEKAKQAAALIIYANRKQKEIDPTESIIYCVPQKSSPIHNRNTITIDASEIKFLPIQEVLKFKSKIFKIAMYGNIQDLRFINKLNKIKSIVEITTEKERGIGLKIKGPKDVKNNDHLKNHIFIPSDAINPFYIPQCDNFKPLGMALNKYRFNDHNIFDAPIILINEGSKKSDICVSYSDYNCIYPNSVYGVSLKGKSIKYHKALTLCLNSSLAKYFFISISSSWGIDRSRVLNKEAVSFPAITEKFSAKAINQLEQYFDSLKNLIIGEGDFTKRDSEIHKIQFLVDKIIYDELKITVNEQILIENILYYSNVIKEKFTNIGANKPVIVNTDIRQYSQLYLEVINKHFKDSAIRLRAEIFPDSNMHDELVFVKFIFDKNNSRKKSIEESDTKISNVLHQINEYTFKEYSASIYYRRIIKYDLKNEFYLLKPNQKRFWTKAIALNDADNLIVEILNQRNN